MKIKDVLQNMFEAGYTAGYKNSSQDLILMHPAERALTSAEQMFELVWSEYKDRLPSIEPECACEKNTGGTVKKVLKCDKCGKDVKGIIFETT